MKHIKYFLTEALYEDAPEKENSVEVKDKEQSEEENKVVNDKYKPNTLIYNNGKTKIYYVTDYDFAKNLLGGTLLFTDKNNTNSLVSKKDKFEYFKKKYNVKGYYIVFDNGARYCFVINRNNTLVGIWNSVADNVKKKYVDEYKNERKHVDVVQFFFDVFSKITKVDIDIERLVLSSLDLLTEEEASKLPKEVLTYKKWWWLKTAGNSKGSTLCCLSEKGEILKIPSELSSVAVRPKLHISNLTEYNIDKYSEIKLFGNNWFVLSKTDLLYNGTPIVQVFDDDGDSYEYSDIREYLDEWLADMKDKQVEDIEEEKANKPIR